MAVRFREKASQKTITSIILASLIFGFVLGTPVAEASQTIYIRPDGKIDPSDAPILAISGATYIFTDNIYGPIVLQRDSIILDGAGYTLQGDGNGIGITLQYRSNVTIRNMMISAFNIGIDSYQSSNNTVAGNTLANNRYGLVSRLTHNDSIQGNHIIQNDFGVWYSASSDNAFHRNNFIENTQHVYMDIACCITGNLWDDGTEGNYWSNYTGKDADSDGIGNTPHDIVENNTDNHPLVGLFQSFNASQNIQVAVISNSTIEDFEYLEPNGPIRVFASNMTPYQTHGFCRLRIPNALMPPPYNVTVNSSPVTHDTILQDDGFNIIYFSYEHSDLIIEIIPEFPPLAILSLFLICSMLVAYFRKKQRQP